MVVRWTELAEDRLEKIFQFYFDAAGHRVAQKTVSEIVNSADSLSFMPYKAPVEQSLTGRKFVYRSLTVNKIFKIVYFIDEQSSCVVISTIWDCRRNPFDLQRDIR